MPSLRTSLVACLFVASGCAKPDPAPPVAQPQEAATSAESIPPMDQHFVKANDIKLAIIKGDLEAAKTPAKWMTNSLDKQEVPARWRVHVPPVKQAANKVVSADDLEDAARGVADMARACGACHSAVGVEVGTSTMQPPSEGEGTGPHMDRHQWAVDKMYEGLIGPSDEAWTVGAATLMEAPLFTGDKAPKDVVDLSNKVHAMGASAKDQVNADQRAGHYAELIGTCATCHKAVGRT